MGPRRRPLSLLRRRRQGAGRIPDYERLLSKREIHRLVGRDDPLILEIGCNDGGDTLEFLAEFPGCRIHCFECDPRAIRDFRGRVSDERCRLYETAVSNSTGTATLHMSSGTHGAAHKDDWDLSSSLLEPAAHLSVHPWVTFERSCEVPTIRLDEWAEGTIGDELVDFVWMDVQGAEHLVVRGGRSTFARTRFCYFEYSDDELYEGQQDLDGILAALPGHRLLATYQAHNALVVNTALD